MSMGRRFIWMAIFGVLLWTGRSTDVEAQTATGKDTKAVIDTKFGSMEIRFFPDKAPKHVENFIKLAKSGFYDKTIFHRVIPGFMIQGGDRTPKTRQIRANTVWEGPATGSKLNSTTVPMTVAQSPWPVPRIRTALAHSFSLL